MEKKESRNDVLFPTEVAIEAPLPGDSKWLTARCMCSPVEVLAKQHIAFAMTRAIEQMLSSFSQVTVIDGVFSSRTVKFCRSCLPGD